MEVREGGMEDRRGDRERDGGMRDGGRGDGERDGG